MMAGMNTQSLLDDILRREGGFVDHPSDRGGPTKYGITQAALSDYRGRPVSVDDVRTLSEHEARAIYVERYVSRPGFDRLEHTALMALLVDCAVNHGVTRAAKWLQQAARRCGGWQGGARHPGGGQPAGWRATLSRRAG